MERPGCCRIAQPLRYAPAAFWLSSLGAPAGAVCCFPIYEGSTDSLAMEHLPDVGTRFTGEEDFSSFRVEPSSMLYPSRYRNGLCLFQPLMVVPPWACLAVGLPCVATWRSDDFSTFHVIAFSDNLDGTWTPVAIRSRAGMLETCSLTTHANTRKHASDLLAPVGLYRVDGACGPSNVLTILSNPSP